MSSKLESATSGIEIALGWEAKNQPSWVVRCLQGSLVNYLSIVVCGKHSQVEAVTWLRQNRVDDVLKWHADSTGRLLMNVSEGKLPASVLGGAYGHIVLSHLASLLGLQTAARSYCDVSCRKDVAEISTPFWNTYAQALDALFEGKKFVAKLGKLRGQERYWVNYLTLMNAVTSGDDLQPAFQAVDLSFGERNRDATISDDNYETEGSAKSPALWDFRKAALMNILGSK
jgi:hypothetical protein